jgi:membrane protease YdiL (CAAX protease family)
MKNETFHYGQPRGLMQIPTKVIPERFSGNKGRFFAGIFRNRADYHNENIKEMLYKNGLRESLFLMLAFLGAFIVCNLGMYFYSSKSISNRMFGDLCNGYFFTVVALGFVFLPFSPKKYGFNFNKLKYNLFSGSLIGIAGCLCAVLSRLYLVNNGYREFAFNVNPTNMLRCLILYPVVAFSQETVTKGYFQTYFVAMLEGMPGKKTLSIGISSLVFSCFHILFGLPVALFTFIFSFCTGFIYEKSRSLTGVWLIHVLTGLGFFLFSTTDQ